MSLGYHLLDVPESLTPSSFLFLTPCSSPPATQPRNPPEPKNKDVQWPQAEDLKQLDEKYRELVEKALEECHNNGIKKWCNTRSEKKDESEGQDIRQWQEMFKIMEKFNSSKEKSIIQLSKGLRLGESVLTTRDP